MNRKNGGPINVSLFRWFFVLGLWITLWIIVDK